MKTVLITGGSRGIGKAIAIELGKSFNVAVGYSSSKEDGEEVVEEIMKSNGTATAVEINVTSTESVENAFVAIEKEYGICNGAHKLSAILDIFTLLSGLPFDKLSVMPFAQIGSIPKILQLGFTCLKKDPNPLIKPPPPTETNILSIFLN